MKKILLLLALLLPAFLLPAQTARQIKEDAAVLWGEGHGEDRHGAALEALLGRLAATDLLPVPKARSKAVWQTYRADVLSASEMLDGPSSTLRYLRWDETGKIFSRRIRLAQRLLKRAETAMKAGHPAEAGTCLQWAAAFLEALPAQPAMQEKARALAGRLGQTQETTVPGLGYVAREVAQIRSALGQRPRQTPEKAPVAKSVKPLPQQAGPAKRPSVRPAFAPLPRPLTLPGATLATAVSAPVPALRRVPAPQTAAVTREPAHGETILLVTAGLQPGLPTGLMAGWAGGRLGGYLSARITPVAGGAAYECRSDGATSFGRFWASGRERTSAAGITGGILVRTGRHLLWQAGAGYGRKTLQWEDAAGRWAKVSDRSTRGLLVETGLLWHTGPVVLYGGVSALSFQTLAPSVGVGLQF